MSLRSIMRSLQVAWMHFEQSAILTVHNHVITRNPRISVTHVCSKSPKYEVYGVTFWFQDKHDKHKTWFLHIANVQEEDKGRYMCQINTVTAKTQFGYLHVVGKLNNPSPHSDISNSIFSHPKNVIFTPKSSTEYWWFIDFGGSRRKRECKCVTEMQGKRESSPHHSMVK